MVCTVYAADTTVQRFHVDMMKTTHEQAEGSAHDKHQKGGSAQSDDQQREGDSAHRAIVTKSSDTVSSADATVKEIDVQQEKRYSDYRAIVPSTGSGPSTYAPLSIQQSEALDSLLRDATTGEVKWKGSLVKNQDGTLAWTNKTAPVRQYGSPFQEKSSRAFSARAR